LQLFSVQLRSALGCSFTFCGELRLDGSKGGKSLVRELTSRVDRLRSRLLRLGDLEQRAPLSCGSLLAQRL